MVDSEHEAVEIFGQPLEIGPDSYLQIEGAVRCGAKVYVVVDSNAADVALSLIVDQDYFDCELLMEHGVVVSECESSKGPWILRSEGVPVSQLSLAWQTASGVRGRSSPFWALERAEPTVFVKLAAALLKDLSALKVGSPPWQQLLRLFPDRMGGRTSLRGRIEYAGAVVSGLGTILSGWEVHREGAVVWLEDGQGHCYDLTQAYRYSRQDVQSTLQLMGYGLPDCGFKAYAPGFNAPGTYRLCAAGLQGLESSACSDVSVVDGTARDVARSIFALSSSPRELIARAQRFDWPLLDRAIERQRSAWQRWQPDTWTVGDFDRQPEVSVVVPLYGRTDLVEHQLIEFSKDPDFRQAAELIYVIDDPKILDHFSSLTGEVYGRYGVPFRWIWGHENRGFAGANNLGAEFARGQCLLFMNSDVIPVAPGWVSKLKGALDTQPSLGAVGPRLLFAGGGIQHAGMRPVWNDRLGIWHNQHIMMGFDPALDRNSGLTEVPLITGACVMLRRTDFDAIGGWDTGYLIGDYEDSELCMRLRDRGMSVAYLPEVDLVHLERQSFKGVGDDQFRQRVTHLNAVRYRDRWNEKLQSLCRAGAA